MIPSRVVNGSFKYFLHIYKVQHSTVRLYSCVSGCRALSSFHGHTYSKSLKFSTSVLQRKDTKSKLDKIKDLQDNQNTGERNTDLRLQSLERDLREGNLEGDLGVHRALGEDSKAYTDVFFFKYITQMRLFLAVNKFNMGAALVFLPYSVFLVPENTTYFLAYAGLATMVFSASTWLLKRVCAVISVSKENNEIRNIRISYMGLSGKRKEKYYKTDDFVPLSELKDAKSNSFIVMETYENKEKWYLFPQCGVVDKEAMDVILGGHVSTRT